MSTTADRQKFLNPLILILLGAGLLRLSWQKWANITWDYGRELYTPWQILHGQVLYKDIASLYGPFPPYCNALLFKVFGVSIMTLALFNVLLVAGMTILIYRFFNYTGARRSALFASAAFLSLFAFTQNHVTQGLFSYICPYTYSVTYAVFFSLWALNLFMAQGRDRPKDVLWGAVGILTGLTALCRFEIFAALAIAIFSGFILMGVLGHWPLKRFLTAGALLLGGFFVPVSIAYLYFSTQLPVSQVWPSILGFNDKWREILQITVYRYWSGFNDPWSNFKIMLTTAACYGIAIIAFKALCMGADRLEKGGKRWAGVFFIVLGLAGIVRIVAWILFMPYEVIFKGLPVVVILMLGGLSWLLWRHRQEEQRIECLLPLWAITAWALLMSLKVLLNVQFNAEGFVYAMPAALLFFVLLHGFIPEYLKRIHKNGYFILPLASVLAVLILIKGVGHAADVYLSRNLPIRTWAGTVICDGSITPATREVAAFLGNVDKFMGKDASFVAFPQGVMLNFLAKRPDPLPYIIFHTAEMIKYGQRTMLRSFLIHKPEYIVLTNEGILLNGSNYPAYRKEFPVVIKAWILAHYDRVWPTHPQEGNEIMILKRRDGKT